MKQIYGFDTIKEEILNNFYNNKLHHCNLINGKKGIGKNSFATNIASFILSQKNNEMVSEEMAEQTKKLMESGGHTDFRILDLKTIDVDGKENTSKKEEINVNQARKIIEDINLTPSLSKNKVLIVDSIDKVNINAQNALLKTLEEPPKNTYIFLICHNISRVITTIQSRSNIINIKGLTSEEWSKALEEELADYDEFDYENIEDLEYLSDYSIGYTLDIIKNNAIEYFYDMLDLMVKYDVLEIQKFAEKINSPDLLKLFSDFFDKIFQIIFESKYDNSILYEKNEEIFRIILKKYSTEELINLYEIGRQIINDINVYNLDKKHCITVLFNKFL